MESYHGMLACVIAGAGHGVDPAQHAGEYARPSAGFRGRWPKSAGSPRLVWRRGAKTRQLEAYSAAERRSANSGFSINTLSGSG